jgi:hypothetical protein
MESRPTSRRFGGGSALELPSSSFSMFSSSLSHSFGETFYIRLRVTGIVFV